MKPVKNIQEYVVQKVLEELKKDNNRIEYLEQLLKDRKICFDGNCGCCKRFLTLKKCGEKYIGFQNFKDHRHCNDCYTTICLMCDVSLCNKCVKKRERKDYVNSF